MATSSNTASPGVRGRLLAAAGVSLAFMGVIAFAVRMSLQRLTFPWYMPCLAAVGVALVAASLWERRSVWRALALLVVVLLTTAEGAMLYAIRLPSYTGPITVGRAFPAFGSVRADGTSFTHRDLVGDQNTVLVFFRGRW